MKRFGMRSVATLLVLVFASCVAETTAGPARSGITGIVQAGPTCPVETPESPCPDQPVPDALVSAMGGPGRTTRKTRTDDRGAFRLRVRPGTYDVTASSDSVFDCDSMQVKVAKNRYSVTTITCDTGLR